MQIKADTPEQYLRLIPEDRRQAISNLRSVIIENIPGGFSETMSYGAIGYVIPHTIYPKGYHCDTSLPLPFMGIASQKHFIAVYHLGLYSDKKLMEWFVNEFPKHSKSKLDMGKSCIRFKKTEHIPYKLIGELTGKINVSDWINVYEANIKSKKPE